MQPEFEAILASDLPEADKLARAFQLIITQHMEHSRRDIELLKALGDKDALIKEQIKLGVLEYSLGVWAHCYYRVMGRKVADD
jgi:hypothetical protein